MSEFSAFEIPLVENNPQDTELTVRALEKRNLANKLHVNAHLSLVAISA